MMWDECARFQQQSGMVVCSISKRGNDLGDFISTCPYDFYRSWVAVLFSMGLSVFTSTKDSHLTPSISAAVVPSALLV